MNTTNHLLLYLLFPTVFVFLFAIGAVLLFYRARNNYLKNKSTSLIIIVQGVSLISMLIICVLVIAFMGKSLALSAFYLTNQQNIPQMCAEIENIKYEKAQNEGIININSGSSRNSTTQTPIRETYNVYYTYFDIYKPEVKYKGINPIDIIFKKGYNSKDEYKELGFCFRGNPEIYLFEDISYYRGKL
jgi:hypothetical protein